MGCSRKLILGPIIIGSIFVLLILILIPLSFDYLDFNYYGFIRRRSTGTVDTETVYSGGRHFIGPDFEFKRFYAAAQFADFDGVSIFTSDNLQVSISVDLQYFIIKDDLKLLHDNFDIQYIPRVIGTSRAAIKNSVTKFDTDQFISNRSLVRDEIFRSVRNKLSGICCLPDCKENCVNCKSWEKCDPGCKPREQCTEADKGIFVEARYLQISDIEITSQVTQRRLLQLIRELEEEKEESVKEELIIRKQTELEVDQYINQARESIANATAVSKLLVDQAQVEYSRLIENVHNDGLKAMYDGLGMNTDKFKSSLNYIRTLQDHEKIKYSIDFDSLFTSG